MRSECLLRGGDVSPRRPGRRAKRIDVPELREPHSGRLGEASLPRLATTRGKFSVIWALLLVSVIFAELPVRAQSSGPPLRGYLTAHDPSTVIQCKNRYYMFYTGQGILSKSSSDRVFWAPGPAVFSNPPAWTSNAVPGFTGLFWAPDVLYFNNLYHLWYAVSTFGSQVSAIGLVTSPTLDPTDPTCKWTDQGPVITSTNGSPYNTIDPSFTWDGAGNLWMAFGSYWNGIYMVQLNATNGLRISANSPTYHLAYNSSIEASYVYKRGGYYYLFADWGSCCSGVNSTYNIRMGRSTSVTGPYLDQNGVDMVNNGGTLFQGPTGKFVGPGHVGILNLNGTQWWSYHYYDANAWAPQYGAYGAPDLALVPLSWTTDNWPTFTNTWSALYRFQADARDDNGQFYGLLENGAEVLTNSIYGHVLNLNGNDQFAWLPPGAGYGQTFAAVVNWRGGADWQRIFDFGVNTAATVMLTAASSDNALRCDINPGGNLQTVQWTKPLPTNAWTHVAVTFNGSQGVLYVNGLPVATNTSMTLEPFNVAPQTNALGQSKFSADPYFNGQYAAFRAYSHALSPQEIVAPVPEISQPADGSAYTPGATISFAGTATDFAAVPLAAANLTWQINYIQDHVTNAVYGPVSGISNGAYIIPTNSTGGGNYVVVLTAADKSNRVATATATLSPANPPAGWSSYFPLQSDANDANGHYNGTLHGGASFVNDAVRGNVLSLNGNSQYVSFPPGLGGMLTFMAWVKWNGGAEWQRIYDFGNDTNFYSVLTPAASSGDLRFNISVDSTGGEQIIDAPGPLPIGVWTHVAVVMDGDSVTLYTNGIPVGTNLHANLSPVSLNATNIYFGKSQWPADPYFNGELSDVRIFSYPLASNQIAAPQITIQQPAQGSMCSPGNTIAFSASANDFSNTPIAAANFIWTVNYINGSTTNVVGGPWSGVASGTFLVPATGPAARGHYQFSVAVTDSAGRSGTNSSSIYLAATAMPTNWASYYPFNSGAQDAASLYNGTLQGGASIATDPTRGPVLSLSGSSQYVSLPAGAGDAQTVAGWVKWEGGSSWQRIFDFGQGDQDYFFLTTSDGSNRPQFSITTDIGVYNQEVEGPAAFPLNQWTYVAVVMDTREAILYLNGSAVAVNNSINLLPSDVAPTQCFLGRSEYAGDPYFYGMMDSFLLNSQPLPISQFLQPPPISISAAGSVLNLSWPQWAGALSLYAATNLAAGGWIPVANNPVATNQQFSVSLPMTNFAQFFRLQP